MRTTNLARLSRRTIQTGALTAALVLCATAGHGETKRRQETRACTATYKQAQERDHAGKLREEKALLATCAQAPCTKAQRKKCTAKAARLEAEIPSVIPKVTNDARTDVQFRMDGEILTSRLDGRAISVDPGVHEFTFSTPEGVSAPQRLTITRGERGRAISGAVKVAARPAQPVTTAEADKAETPPEEGAGELAATEAAAAEAPASRGAPTSAYLLGGLGLAGLGAGALFTVWGRNDNSRLQSECAPDCNVASVNHAKRMYLVADVSLGVGIAALGVAGILFATANYGKEGAAPVSAYKFDVQPTRSGAFASVSGAF